MCGDDGSSVEERSGQRREGDRKDRGGRKERIEERGIERRE